MEHRALTANEAAILHLIQEEFGPQNASDEVFITEGDEAAIFVEAEDGSRPGFANLTTLAAWRADGTLNEDDLKLWLQPHRPV